MLAGSTFMHYSLNGHPYSVFALSSLAELYPYLLPCLLPASPRLQSTSTAPLPCWSRDIAACTGGARRYCTMPWRGILSPPPIGALQLHTQKLLPSTQRNKKLQQQSKRPHTTEVLVPIRGRCSCPYQGGARSSSHFEQKPSDWSRFKIQDVTGTRISVTDRHAQIHAHVTRHTERVFGMQLGFSVHARI